LEEEERVWFIARNARGKETTRKTKVQVVDNIRLDLVEI
jgi:hypothetical protein